jgi:hypothetical protein
MLGHVAVGRSWATGRSRASIAALVALVLALTSTAAVLLWPKTSRAEPPTQATPAGNGFVSSGNAGATGDRWDAIAVDIPRAGRYRAVLSWADSAADLNLFVKDPAGQLAGEALGATDRPERLTFRAAAAGSWRVGVKAKSGRSAYTVRVEPVDAAPTPSASPTATATPSPTATPTPTATSTATPTPPTPGGTGDVLRVAAYENENSDHRLTEAEAVADARRFDFLSAVPLAYKDHLPAMKRANPKLVVVGYMNAMFAQKTQGSAYPEAWYARDAAGNKVRSNNYGNYLMQPVSGWVESRRQACREILAMGYTGCFLDMLGDAPTLPHYVTSLPINPATHQPWTSRDYLAATTRVGTAIRDAAGAKALVLGNGYVSGARYFGGSSVMAAGLDGSIAESAFRDARDSVTKFRTEERWKLDVDMAVDAGRKGKTVVYVTKVWANGTQAQKDAYQKYMLASFLLGTDGRSYFACDYGGSPRSATEAKPYYGASLGAPSGAYAKIGGAYQRSFAHGKVVVNPTDSTVTVSLGGIYRDAEGAGAAITTLTLQPHGSAILAKA